MSDTNIIQQDNNHVELEQLVDKIANEIEQGRIQLAININTTVKNTYWNVGRYIVEFEQKGASRARYGSSLLTRLSQMLRLRVGRGYSRPNLNNMRKFYLMYPICQTSDKLSWSHICELITIDDPLEREFYEKECIACSWDVRSLHRQMESGLFLRLAASKDKQGILQLAREGQTVQKPQDAVKSTYTLEFLGLEDQYSESELEQRLIDNMQTFMLELGKGFSLYGRQYPLTVNNHHYHVDLVFYHRILHCFVLIDLKKGAVKHQDIGQMNMYLGFFAEEENLEGDNPPIGIIMSHFKDELMVKYATYGMDTNLFVSKYELYLPNKEELRKLVNRSLEQK